jgi:hypothetical protein
MPEPWLKANRRIHFLALAPLMAVAAAGLLIAWLSRGGLRACGAGLALLGLLGGLIVLWHMRFPRLAYGDGCLHLFLRGTTPARVPVDVVECFFSGQGSAGNPPRANLILRLAEAAPQWHERAVDRRLGRWCDGYVTIDGMWCEPLNRDLINRLNERLVAAKRREVLKEHAP